MSTETWLLLIQLETALVLLICLVGNLRAANFIGRVARKKNRPISKSTMIGLNILLLGAVFSFIIALRANPPADWENAVMSILRNAMWASLALKTIITEEIIIRRPEKLFMKVEQRKIADELGIEPWQVDRMLRIFLK